MTAVGDLAQAYVVRFPEGLPHTLTTLKQGGFSTVVRGDKGKIVGSASLYPVVEQALVLGVFTAMSVASGQYFLARINNELKVINQKLDDILAFLYGDKRVELLSEVTFAKYAHQNYRAIMGCEHQKIATITSLQEAKKVAIKDIEFYLNDLNVKTNLRKNISQEEKDALANELFQMKSSLELSMQLYVMSTLLEIYYAQNFDTEYLTFLEEDIASFIEKCNNYMLSSFAKLEGTFAGDKSLFARFAPKGDKSPNEQKIGNLIDELKNSDGLVTRKTIQSAFLKMKQGSTYYFSTDGNVYVENTEP